MKAVIQKAIPVALAALLTACGGGGGGSSGGSGSTDPLAALTYTGKVTDGKITDSNKDAMAKEAVEFVHSFITVSRFQKTDKDGLDFNDNVAGYWFDIDLYESDLLCDSGTYKGSTTEKDEDIYELNYKAELSQCALTIADGYYKDGSYIFDGSASLYDYEDTKGSHYSIKEGYDYNMNITADGEKIKKQGRGNYKKYYEYADSVGTKSETFEFTTIMDVYGNSYKYTNDNGVSLVKSPAGKVFKSPSVESVAKYSPGDEDMHGRYYVVAFDSDGSAEVYLPSFGLVDLISSPYESGSEAPLRLCDKGNFSAGTIQIYSHDPEGAAMLKITFTECGKYTVSVIDDV